MPLFITDKAPINTAISVEGIVIIIICGRVTSNPAREPTNATVAAEIGEATSPCIAAITLIDIGLSGLIPAFRDISAITGSNAYITCCVPAANIKM